MELSDYLWKQVKGGEIYMLLDGARDPRIYTTLPNAALEHCCLYDGEVPEVLARAAPYLVRLQPWSPFTSWLFNDGRGQSWGVLLSSRATLIELRRHFRRFLMVRDESGKQLYFRYYDPRVLKVYLPTCTPEELKQLFGPVERFWIESPEGLLECLPDGASRAVLV
jgi:hypothetical protein